MRAGRRTAALIVFPLLLALFLSLPLAAAEKEEILAKIRAGMQEVRTLSADFDQTREIVSIRHRLTIRGELALDRAGRMAWRVREPIRYACVIDGAKLTQWDEESGSVLTLDVSKNPGLKILASSMASYFSGDFDAMAAEFEITPLDERRLRLVPRKENTASALIRELEFEIAPDFSHITRVRITEKSGDVTAIRFSNVCLNQEIPSSTWRAEAK